MSKGSAVPLISDLDRLPSLSSAHVWADYVELRAVTSQDKVFSSGLLADSVDMAGDVATDADSSFDDDSDAAEEGLSDLDDPNVNREQKRLKSKWGDVKVALTSRSARMGKAWPFSLEGDVLRLNFDKSNNLHQLYVALLIASSLRYVSRRRHQEIADQLERIGASVFRLLMPPLWEVRVFGANGGEYTGTKVQKLQSLARDIRAKPLFDAEDVKDGDRGDGGLDVVAWHAFDDCLGQIPIAFAQCGCSPTDIDYKQLQASPASVNRWFKPGHPAANYFIAPVDFRNNQGRWERLPAEVILVDRARILELVRKHGKVLTPPSFVDEALSLRLPMGA